MMRNQCLPYLPLSKLSSSRSSPGLHMIGFGTAATFGTGLGAGLALGSNKFGSVPELSPSFSTATPSG